MDYGRTLQFGYFLTPSADKAQDLGRVARRCEDLGLDLLGIQDHPYQRRFLDTWTLLAYLAACTSRIRLCSDVVNLPLRPPAMLAKAAASLDLLSGGRFDLGIGAGAFWEGIRAMGGPSRTPGEAVAALEEAVQIIRMIWRGERGARFAGKHYELRGMNAGPVPQHPLGIWIGAYGPRMLEITGRLGDGWIPSSSYAAEEQLPAMQARIDQAARDAGRDPADIRRIYNVMGSITGGESKGFLQGPPDQWVDELSRLALKHGFDTFIFSPAGAHEQQIGQFAQEIVPRVKEQAAQARGSSAAL